MDNKKIAKVTGEIEKTKAKLAELQAQLKDLERQKTELENTDIVDMVRGLSISLADLPALLQSLAGGKPAAIPAIPATSGQFGPKSQPKPNDKEESANEE